MILIGLTGGMGMGKSTAARLLLQRGVPVVDTDDLARAVVEPGQPALDEVRQAFGPAVLGADGRLDRGKLAETVFGDPAQRERLERILHPRIRERWLDQAAQWRAAGRPCGAVVIPLLYETLAAREFDAIICVACSAASQQARLLQRGWSAEHIAQRLAAQWPIAKKMDAANFVLWSEPSLAVHGQQVDWILERLKADPPVLTPA
jgi:dephospho-CoA kinase